MSLQERIEGSRRGRRAIGAALVVLLALMVVDNLPPSAVQREGMKVAEPVLTALGARQNWDLYSPDPFQSSTEVEVRMLRVDGGVTRWRPPEGGPFVSPYRSYRWGKFAERVDERTLGVGLLTWAVEEEDDPSRPVVAARLVRRERRIARPGTPASARGPWRETVLVELDVLAGR